MMSGIFIPTLGCWEITGNYQGHELTFVVWVTSAGQQSCDPHDLEAALPADNPAYGDAMNVAEKLKSQGLAVKCVGSSTMESLFYGQAGAATCRTSQGDFTALFLPTSQDRSGLKVIRRRQNDLYAYFFRGRPRLQSTSVEGRQMYFVRYANLFVAFDLEMANRLDKIFNSPQSNSF